ncbi:alpha-hydroxy-acid oxidizing protein [Sphingomonas sp. CL5.1]|uniref:alpha-hydroxy acid oxidase n=1 Tax=Sphingomonas sp. CL5.1 TaxID=2653203 RepID=UPI00158433EF|nr:alpha-hydroxy acid oxidase [Sphingomonas sp. CL5.1]QKR99930.1 alpha-hydroxy-acid oxidizing protein [Sphingomonas sp. CL5.1]
MVSKLDRVCSINDLRRLARKRVPPFVFQPMEQGTGDGRGAIASVAAFDRRRLQSRLTEEPVTVDLSTTIFGRRYAAPIGISAIGYAGKMWPGADVALAEAAVAADVPFILSVGTVADVETIARIAPGRIWQQLYSARDPAITDDFICRAENCGVEVLVHTIDMPVSPASDYVTATGIRPPLNIPPRSWPAVLWQTMRHPAWALAYARVGRTPRLEGWARYVDGRASARDVLQFVGAQMISGAGWREVERVRQRWSGKLVLKGLVHPDDIVRAKDVGADAVTVSNHGGNRMGAAVASLDALDEIVATVPASARPLLMFDGGIRRGEDVAIATATGAAFCFIGRAALYGALAAGCRGSVKALDLLRTELSRTLLHLGTARPAELDRDLIRML